ncbi:hypothetical protein WI560_32035 [Bradyrhizobium sp. A11]|uniref:hypothetical protein n=1 Tax=Bradyrhizobium sp. A11 TaxID=3133974 RepID=UPI00324316DA
MDSLPSRDQASQSVRDWLEGRQPEYLSTNAGTREAAYQGWRPFKEAFAPELIEQAARETSAVLGRKVRTCLDPFGGSGTTSLACQFLGIKPTTVEVNPYLADLIEAKLSSYDVDRLIRDFDSVVSAPIGRVGSPFAYAPATFVEPGVDGRFIFPRPIARRLASYADRIASVRSLVNRRLFRVLLGNIAVETSNVVVSGKGRRYRRNWQERDVSPDSIEDAFKAAVLRAIYEISKFQSRKGKNFELIRGDARTSIPARRKFDLVVTSPPYPNSFDYTDVYNVELWVCGYLKSYADNRKLRMRTLRSHVQIHRKFDVPNVKSKILEDVVGQLKATRLTLWNKKIPEMIESYFADMEAVLYSIQKSLTAGGRAYVVVGDSRYAGIRIPVADILSEISAGLNLRTVTKNPCRSMRGSPQQGSRADLKETLLILSRT